MICYHGILELTLAPDPKEPLADPSLISLAKCDITVLLSYDNGDFAPQAASLAASPMYPTAGSPSAISPSQQLGSIV